MNLEVCHIIDHLGRDGAQTFLKTLVTHFPTRVQSTVCYLGRSDELHSEISATEIDVVGMESGYRFDPRGLQRFYRFLISNDFDILHLHLAYAQTFGRIFGSLTHSGPIVSTYHGMPDHYCPDRRMRYLEVVTRPLDTATIAVSKGVKDAFQAKYSILPSPRGMTVIHNGIDVEGFRKSIENSCHPGEIPDDSLVFLNVGRCVPQKGQLYLIDAMSEVVQEIPDAHLVIVGDGPLKSSLIERAEYQSITENVTFTGHISNVHPYYDIADVFVSSSISEAFGLTLIEAMSADLPVVATDIPGAREVVGEAGLKAPAKNPAALAEVMKSMADETTRADKRKEGAFKAKSDFDISRCVKSHLNLYEYLLDSKK